MLLGVYDVVVCSLDGLLFAVASATGMTKIRILGRYVGFAVVYQYATN